MDGERLVPITPHPETDLLARLLRLEERVDALARRAAPTTALAARAASNAPQLQGRTSVYALTWMLDVLRAAGLAVEEVDGWRNRGHGNVADIRGVMLHHTAGPPQGRYPSLSTVVRGNATLPGPRANLGLARDGTWLLIAAGQAWHAGKGAVGWCGRDNGNPHLIGIEAESTGRGDWTPAQLDAYPRGVAALLRHLGLGAGRALAHKEWAPNRKIDPAGWPGDINGFRDTVAHLMNGAPMADPTAVNVWSHIIDHPQRPDLKHAAWVWLAYTNDAAWRAARYWDESETSAVDEKTPVRRMDFLRHVDARTHHMVNQLTAIDARLTALSTLLAKVAEKVGVTGEPTSPGATHPGQ